MKKTDEIKKSMKFTGTTEDTSKGKVKGAGKKAVNNINNAMKKGK